MDRRQKLLTTALIILILLLAIGLRFCCLDTQSLWNDEGTSVALAQRDLATITHDAARDIHPPLYYWILSCWVRLFGSSEVAVRSLSAFLGVLLVATVFTLGTVLVGRWIGLLAAFLAAISPFQVYFSQEARMYMLVAVLTTGAVLALVGFVRRDSAAALAALVLLETAGLYTHYTFAFVVLILNLGYLLQMRKGLGSGKVWLWVFSQVAVVLLYIPWLPTAIRQAITWPNPAETTALPAALAHVWQLLLFGHSIETGQVTLALVIGGAAAVLGAICLGLGCVGADRARQRWAAGLLVIWALLPVAVMLLLGLYRDSYLKFLLAASPASSLLLACGLLAPLPPGRVKALFTPRSGLQRQWLGIYGLRGAQLLAVAVIVLFCAVSLWNIYTEPVYARDDYRGIATYIEAASRPGDAILLNAPGQQEVFGYYYDGALAVHPLPQSRPLDPVATRSSLEQLVGPGGRVYAVLWATDESDPERFVEAWLNENAYKALDAWHGNVRLVVYSMSKMAQLETAAPEERQVAVLLDSGKGDEIRLVGTSRADGTLAAGDIAQLALFWEAAHATESRYKVFVHLLDEANHIVGQRDSEPGGGAKPTNLWAPGETIVDHYGVPIHPATPPGEYRVEVGMYDLETGRRLVTPDGEDRIWLDPITVVRPPVPAPVAALQMQQGEGTDFGELALLGYDAYRSGFSHQPEQPVQPGDVLHTNFYWHANGDPSVDWLVEIGLLSQGKVWASLLAEPVAGYPTSQWRDGDVWRGQFDLMVPTEMPAGRYRIVVHPQGPDGPSPELFHTEPLEIGP